jgi:hypothetical protein
VILKWLDTINLQTFESERELLTGKYFPVISPAKKLWQKKLPK